VQIFHRTPFPLFLDVRHEFAMPDFSRSREIPLKNAGVFADIDSAKSAIRRFQT